MAEGHIIWKKCSNCNGTGVNEQFVSNEYGVGEVTDVVCDVCNGDKYLVWGWASKDDAELPDFLPAV